MAGKEHSFVLVAVADLAMFLEDYQPDLLSTSLIGREPPNIMDKNAMKAGGYRGRSLLCGVVRPCAWTEHAKAQSQLAAHCRVSWPVRQDRCAKHLQSGDHQ
eukprot:5000537-Amphidinium_carterae.1